MGCSIINHPAMGFPIYGNPHRSLVEMSIMLRKDGNQWNDWAKGLPFPSSLHGVSTNLLRTRAQHLPRQAGLRLCQLRIQWRHSRHNGWFLGKEPGNRFFMKIIPRFHVALAEFSHIQDNVQDEPNPPGDSTYIKQP